MCLSIEFELSIKNDRLRKYMVTLDDGIQYRFDFSKYYLFLFISKIKIYLSVIRNLALHRFVS